MSNTLAHWSRLVVATSARAALFSLAGMLLFASVPALWGWVPTTVMSDSMAPALRAGDVVVAMPIEPTAVRIGQVLLFADPDHTSRLRLHRLAGLSDTGMLVTKGDANASTDSTPAAAASVRGAAVLRIPYVGLVTTWFANRQWVALGVGLACIAALVALTRIDRYLLLPRPGEEPVEGMPRHRGLLKPRGIARIANGGTALAALALAVVSVMAVTTTSSHAAFTRTTNSGAATLQGASAYACLSPTPSDSPWFFFGYNEETGTAATDLSGSAHPGTLTTGVARVGGSCVKNASPYVTLNGTTGQVTNSPAVVALLGWSQETWIKTSTTSGGNIMSFGDSATGTSGVHDRHLYMGNTGKVYYAVATALGVVTIASTANLNDGAWHHLVATGTLTQSKLYVDGALQATGNGVFLSLGGNLRVGYDTVTGLTPLPTSAHFSGSLDNTAFYPAVLSQARVTAHYTTGH